MKVAASSRSDRPTPQREADKPRILNPERGNSGRAFPKVKCEAVGAGNRNSLSRRVFNSRFLIRNVK
jgi:hypothetical protein